jgi:hypothetical protein
MRTLISLSLSLLTAVAVAEDWQVAKVLGAETHGTENALAVQIGDMAVVASYTARWSVLGSTREGRRASDLVVGETIQARIDGSRLLFVMPGGNTMRARIVRRELRGDDEPFVMPAPDLRSRSSDHADARGQREMEERQRCFQRQQTQHGLGGPVPNAALC